MFDIEIVHALAVQVAERIGVEPSFLSKVERDQGSPPSEDTLVRLAADLEVDADLLLALAGKVSRDLREAIRRRPMLFAELIQELKDMPDTALVRLVREVRQLGGAFARPGEHPSAFASRAAAYSLLVVGISEIPGVEDHAAAILEAMAPRVDGHRLPNFTFTPEEYVDAYDEVTLARLRRAVRTYDPDGVMTIGGVLG